MLNCVIETQNPFYINDNTLCRVGDGQGCKKEYYHNAKSWDQNARQLSFCDLIAFFCATKDGNYQNEKLDYIALSQESIKISTQYNYNHILPPITVYKKLIDEVLLHRDVVVEYLIKIGINDLESKDNVSTNMHVNKGNTYFQKFLCKIRHRTNIFYLKHKLRKIFRC